MGSAYFEGFALESVELAAGRLRLRRGGEGPPLLARHDRGARIPSGHYLAEEAPAAVLESFLSFFT